MAGWNHGAALREYALEAARKQIAPTAPSRSVASFAFVTEAAAIQYRSEVDGFKLHVLHRVSLFDPNDLPFVADYRKVRSTSPFEQWPDIYWMGIGTGAPEDFPHAEVLARSDLLVDSCLE